MIQDSPITILLILANVVVSYIGFTKPQFMYRYAFQVGPILKGRQYDRLITSGFLHVNGLHLFVNMMSLYYMGGSLEKFYVMTYGMAGYALYLLVYFGALVGGDLLALAMHRNDPNYSAVGASGAVSGVVFAMVVVAPYATILLFMVIPMPFWIYAIVYMGYTLFGMRTNLGRIGHDAHMGGALIGLVLCCIILPDFALANWLLVTILLVPTSAMLLLMYRNPRIGEDPFNWLKGLFSGNKNATPSSSSNSSSRNNGSGNPFDERVKQDGLETSRRWALQKELDELLDKVSRKGLQNMSPAERARMDELSRLLNRPGNYGGGGGRAPSQ